MVAGVWLSLFGAVFTAQAACSATADELAQHVEGATLAFAAMDSATFGAEREQAYAILGCISEPMPGSLAGAFHRMEALAGYLENDVDRTITSFQAATVADPDYNLPMTLAPEGNLLRDYFEEARAFPARGLQEVTLPIGAWLWVDGARSTVRPIERPAIIQGVGADSKVQWTRYVTPNDPLPQVRAVAVQQVVVSGPARTSSSAPPSARSSAGAVPAWPFFVAAGVSGLASGGLWWAANQSAGRVEELGGAIAKNTNMEGINTAADADALIRRANTTGYVAQATAGLSLSLCAVGVVFVW